MTVVIIWTVTRAYTGGEYIVRSRDAYWFKTCESEDVAERLYQRLKNAGVTFVRVSTDLGGVTDEREDVRRAIAEDEHAAVKTQ